MAKKRAKYQQQPQRDIMGNVQTTDEKPKAQRPDDQKVGAYRIGADTIERVNQTAVKYNVQKADLVKFLIETGIDLLEQGAIGFKVAPPQRPNKINFD